MKYCTGTWNSRELGNHRIVLKADNASESFRAKVYWRRRDKNPESKAIIILSEATGKRVLHVARIEVSREYGELIFQTEEAGIYHLYYLPYTDDSSYFMNVKYATFEETADDNWHNHVRKNIDMLPRAEVVEHQSINDFHSFYPMEVIATKSETDALKKAHARDEYIVFPEDRKYPIRMFDELPLRWIEKVPLNVFEGTTCRNEFYVFQLGVFAHTKRLSSLGLTFEDCKGPDNYIIPAHEFRCINFGGIDWNGRSFVKEVSVQKNKIQPLWCGLRIPQDAKPGIYQSYVTVQASNAADKKMKIVLRVSDEVVQDGAEGELWKHARMWWFDSTLGIDERVPSPFKPVQMEGHTVKVLGREMELNDDGLPCGIRSYFSHDIGRLGAEPTEILAKPMRFTIEAEKGELPFSIQTFQFVSQTEAEVAWESESIAEGWKLHCRAQMEYDGYVNYQLVLESRKDQAIEDIALEVFLDAEIATYMMGMGHPGGGGRRAKTLKWKWNENLCNNSFWTGDVQAGLHCRLKHVEEDWPLMNLKQTGTYRDWSNDGKGGCDMKEENGVVCFRVYCGPRTVKDGERLHFNFGLLITPLKPHSQDHWQWRYVQRRSDYLPVEEEKKCGAKIINIHQGNALNPNINYPFLTVDKLNSYVAQGNKHGMKTKLYYTLRELSTHIVELWMLRSLQNEVFTTGAGFADPNALAKQEMYRNHTGDSWICEHLIDDYRAAWHGPLPDGDIDAAIETAGLSRLHNYYVESLRWLLENVGIGGIYLDGIGYDREVMKRVYKVGKAKPDTLFDFHGGSKLSEAVGGNSTVNHYAEHLPYVDSLWFGEGFDYAELTPDFWLLELSGIPFGLFGEMLSDEGGNPFRGMLYGMSERLGWGFKAEPRGMWKLWDDFGIENAEMIGYWHPRCPARSGHKDVLATVYKRNDSTLIVLASWADSEVEVRLDVDWESIGLRPEKTVLHAPEIEGFESSLIQSEGRFKPDTPLRIEPGCGWFLIAREA